MAKHKAQALGRANAGHAAEAKLDPTDLRRDELAMAAEPWPLSISPRENPENCARLLLKASRSSLSRRSSFTSACTACALLLHTHMSPSSVHQEASNSGRQLCQHWPLKLTEHSCSARYIRYTTQKDGACMPHKPGWAGGEPEPDVGAQILAVWGHILKALQVSQAVQQIALGHAHAILRAALQQELQQR